MTRERIELNGHDESARPAASRDEIAARSLHLENDFEKSDDMQFLRTEKRIPVRRGPIAKKTANRLKAAFKLAIPLALIAGMGAAARAYGLYAERFFIPSSDNIEISGVHNASRKEVADVCNDIGRNVFSLRLDERRMKLEKIPWVESATVMRLLPDRLLVNISERTPVAFVQIGAKIHLIDANGVVLGPPASRQTRYSFPVIRGITEPEPLPTRAALMKIYNQLVSELGGNNVSQLSEVDLADAEDVKATVNDAGGTVLIHLGSSDFLERYKLFAAHIGEWRQQFQKVQSVDLRYEGQIVVNPDGEKPAPAAAPPETHTIAKAKARIPSKAPRKRK